MKKPKLLLHSCCAGCSVHIAETLKDEYDVTLFFYNPQIFPEEEYNLRLSSTKKVAKLNGLVVVEHVPDYSKKHNMWLEHVKGYESEPEKGKRCALCFDYNLEQAAKYASEQGFDSFSTTLTVSPHKDAKIIFELGNKAGKKHNVKFLEKDFKKNDGFLLSSKKSKEKNIYRQSYCGCEFSLKRSIASPRE